MIGVPIAHQFYHAKAMGWLPYFLNPEYGLPPHIVMGVASRETGMQNIIGDHGHGYGLMQVDRRSFPEWCASDRWKNPEESVRMGCFVLRSKYNRVMAAGVPSRDILRVSIAAYNCGQHAIDDYRHYGDPDRHTTGHDYSQDVMRRSRMFKTFIKDDQGGQ